MKDFSLSTLKKYLPTPKFFKNLFFRKNEHKGPTYPKINFRTRFGTFPGRSERRMVKTAVIDFFSRDVIDFFSSAIELY